MIATFVFYLRFLIRAKFMRLSLFQRKNLNFGTQIEVGSENLIQCLRWATRKPFFRYLPAGSNFQATSILSIPNLKYKFLDPNWDRIENLIQNSKSAIQETSKFNILYDTFLFEDYKIHGTFKPSFRRRQNFSSKNKTRSCHFLIPIHPALLLLRVQKNMSIFFKFKSNTIRKKSLRPLYRYTRVRKIILKIEFSDLRSFHPYESTRATYWGEHLR